MKRLLGTLLAIGVPLAGHCYEPKVNYQIHCMGCHLADGSGQVDRVPSVRETLVPLSMMQDGREFVMRVPGVAQSPLSDEDLAALLNWMARNISRDPLPAAFRDYTVEEVATRRRRPLAQLARTRRDLIARLSTAPGQSLKPPNRPINAAPAAGSGPLNVTAFPDR